ncbi:MAG: hypothetical protein ABS939_08275 [Psychrobacillus sp.]
MSYIKKLRELGSFNGSWSYYSERDERLDVLESLDFEKVVHSEFKDYGRWSNYETKVYEITEGEEVAYFEYGEEIPATESQEGMDCSFHFREVKPKEVIKVIYVAK